MNKTGERKFERKDHRWVTNKVGDLSGTYFTYLRRKAKDRKLDFLISKEELWDLFEKQKRKCALSGVVLKMSTEVDRNNNVDRAEHTASLDRIDNTKGYTIDNVQWVHKKVNGMRRQYSVKEYIEWCIKVADHSHSQLFY